jgi:hypothetical protein
MSVRLHHRAGWFWIFALAACSGTDTLDFGSTGSAGTTGSGSGAPCGGVICAAGEYCDHSGASGTSCNIQQCRAKPATCSAGGPPVCACDGKVYDDLCSTIDSGESPGFAGCATPAGKFRCDAFYCDLDTEYCAVVSSAVAPPLGDPPVYSCEPIPAGCAPVMCGCLPPACDGVPASRCDGDASKGFTVKCTSAT